jgi:hypothetical protein
MKRFQDLSDEEIVHAIKEISDIEPYEDRLAHALQLSFRIF